MNRFLNKSEATSDQKTASDNGVAGPPGGFPLMVAAETLAASFGVHMNRSQTRGPNYVSTKSPIWWKKADLADLKSDINSTPRRLSSQNSTSSISNICSSHQKIGLLRSTFARMRQVAMGGGAVDSDVTTGPSTNPSTPSTSAFHQRLTHFSHTLTHELSSPRRRKLDLIHRTHQSCQTPQASNAVQDNESSCHPIESCVKKGAHLHLPLTAVLDHNNSLLRTISDEVLGSANELEVAMPMQLAVVDAAMVASNCETDAYVEAVKKDVKVNDEIKKRRETGVKHKARSTATQLNLPGNRSPDKGLESNSAIKSISVSTGSINTFHRENNCLVSRRLLRRPTDPTINIGMDLSDLHQAILLQPPHLYSDRSLVGSLSLHQCARSTFSAFVPFVVELCVTLIEKFGLNCVGIYRVSGNKLAHDFMAAELRKQLGEIDAFNEKWNDIHALACVLKTLLRNLPDSLIPKAMYPEFLSASRVESWERRLLSVQRLLSIMECYPKHPEYRVHRATLCYLATHLARVASRQAVNRMTAYNLALVFAPNVIQSDEDSPQVFIADLKFKIWLLETIIKYHKWVFSPDLGLESGCFVPEDSDKVLLTDEALAEAIAATSVNSKGLEFANQPGRSEGDVHPMLQEMLHAAAFLPPPPSTSDLEVAQGPGPGLDKPTDVTTVVRSINVAQQQQHRQRNRPVSQPGRENRPRDQMRSLSAGRWRIECK